MVQINYFEDNMRFVVSACIGSALPMFLHKLMPLEIVTSNLSIHAIMRVSKTLPEFFSFDKVYNLI